MHLRRPNGLRLLFLFFRSSTAFSTVSFVFCVFLGSAPTYTSSRSETHRTISGRNCFRSVVVRSCLFEYKRTVARTVSPTASTSFVRWLVQSCTASVHDMYSGDDGLHTPNIAPSSKLQTRRSSLEPPCPLLSLLLCLPSPLSPTSLPFPPMSSKCPATHPIRRAYVLQQRY